MIVCNSQLNTSQLKALRALARRGKEFDGGVPIFYYHLLAQKRISDNNILFWENNQLLGFLSVYFFYTEGCEVSLLVDPNHRQRGIAKQLFKQILPLLRAKEIRNLIFSAPRFKENRWAIETGFSYVNREYHMERSGYDPILIPVHHLEIRKAAVQDISTLCALDEACFSDRQEDMAMRFHLLLNDSDYTLMLAFHQGNPVGKAHIHWQDATTVFSDIAILPQYQGQGWGSEMLAYCINYALTQGKNRLSLDVETSNRSALNLYMRHGFKTANVSDYWQIPLHTLSLAWKSD
jgi:ribosomal protein S18 acetylase RimI-like enzyme